MKQDKYPQKNIHMETSYANIGMRRRITADFFSSEIMQAGKHRVRYLKERKIINLEFFTF